MIFIIDKTKTGDYRRNDSDECQVTLTLTTCDLIPDPKIRTMTLIDPGMGNCGKAGQWVPVGVGQPTLMIGGLTIGGSKV